MADFIKRNIALVLAFLLPIALILFVTLSIYIPSKLLSTDYNFIYVSCAGGDDAYGYQCASRIQRYYTVVDGKIMRSVIPPTLDSDKDGIPDINENYTVRIFLHDTAKNESREISYEDAQKLMLSSLLTSPDGVNVSRDREGGEDFFLLFSSSSEYGHYLVKGRSKQKLNLISDRESYYRDDMTFLGWVLPGRN